MRIRGIPGRRPHRQFSLTVVVADGLQLSEHPQHLSGVDFRPVNNRGCTLVGEDRVGIHQTAQHKRLAAAFVIYFFAFSNKGIPIGEHCC
ncbi:hypothetical protein D3C87_1911730 [compost metagenome]